MGRRKTGEESGESRGQVVISLTPDVDRAINLWCDHAGWSRTRLLGRIVTWFVRAPESAQQAVLGIAPSDYKEEFLGKLLEHARAMAESGAAGAAEDESGVGLVHNGTPAIVDPNEAKSRGRKRKGIADE